jgi:hypothetical protein
METYLDSKSKTEFFTPVELDKNNKTNLNKYEFDRIDTV